MVSRRRRTFGGGMAAVLLLAIMIPLVPAVAADDDQNSFSGMHPEGTEMSFPPQTEWEQLFDFVFGYLWIEVHCETECSKLTLSVIDSSGTTTYGSQAGEFITLEGQVDAGSAILSGNSSGTSTINVAVQSVLPIGTWEAEEGDLIPNPGENSDNFTAIDLEYESEQSDLWSINPSWHNGSISNLSDQDVLFLNASEGDVFEIWLVSSRTDIQVRAFSQNATQFANLGELETSVNTSSGSEVLRIMVSTIGSEELWLQIKSDSPFGQYSLRISRHYSLSEDVTIESQVANSNEVTGWLKGAVDEECLVINNILQPNWTSKISLDISSTSELIFSLQFMVSDTWHNVSTLHSWITSLNRHQLQFFTPVGTSAAKVCFQSGQPISWSMHFSILTIIDSPGELPSNNSSLLGNWSQLPFNNNTEGDLIPSIYDSSDIHWFQLEGWPESEFLVRISIENLGDSSLRFTLMEINWSERGTIESANATLNGSQSGELTLKVGPGIHAFKIEHVELADNGGNWSWGNQSPLGVGKYRVYATFVQTEEGEEPWFAPDPRVGEASDKLLMFFGVILLSPFLWIVYTQRTQRVKAQRLIGQKARLTHLLDLLSRGEIKEARADLTENLQIISTLTWEEGIAVWGNPDVHHRTGAVDLAAWKLDKRLAKKGGLPLLIGIHVVTDTWEVAGLRCEAPEGMAWEIVGVEPRLLFREDEVFLDQLHSGTRIFIEVELIGHGSGVEFSLSGTVKGEPSGMKTTEAMGVNTEEE